jgi:hypothetical protein
MSRNANCPQSIVDYSRTTKTPQQNAEPTSVAHPRLLAFAYFAAVFIAMIGWLYFIGWLLWQLIDWVIA